MTEVSLAVAGSYISCLMSEDAAENNMFAGFHQIAVFF